MGVPKKRTSKMKTRLHRSHHALKQTNLAACSHCGTPILSHRACPACGYYQGKMTVAVK
jgi:large subunit ribosomal protein L32